MLIMIPASCSSMTAFLKVNGYIIRKQLTHKFKAVRGIAGEPADGLRQHIVDAPDTAFVEQCLQAVADIRLCAGDASLKINVTFLSKK